MPVLSEDQKQAAALWWAKLFIKNNNTTTKGEKNPDHSWFFPFYREIHKQLSQKWTGDDRLYSEYGEAQGRLLIAINETKKHLSSTNITTALHPPLKGEKIFMSFKGTNTITVSREGFYLKGSYGNVEYDENTLKIDAKKYRHNHISAFQKYLDSKPTTSGDAIDARTNLLCNQTNKKSNQTYRTLKDEKETVKSNPNDCANFNCCTIC